MTKGHMQDGKFHPHTESKGVSRKKRLDYNDPDIIKNSGVKLEDYRIENGHKYRLARDSSISQLEKQWFQLTDVERTKLHILSGTKPEFRPDIEFNINVINQEGRRKIFKLMREEAWKKELNLKPESQIMGISKQNDGTFDLNFIEQGEVVQINFPNLKEASEFKEHLKGKGYVNHQIDEEERLPIVIKDDEIALEKTLKEKEEIGEQIRGTTQLADLNFKIDLLKRSIKTNEDRLQQELLKPEITKMAKEILVNFQKTRNK